MPSLRSGLLDGRGVVLAGGGSSGLRAALEALGARVEELVADDDFGAEEERVGEWARERAPLHALVFDAREPFGSGGEERLVAVGGLAWAVTREVALGAMIGTETAVPGKLVLIGPAAGAGELADGARAALESLVRTLSVEWARFGVTAVMLAPAAGTAEDDLAELVCFLCSPAAEYLSGCRLELR